MTKSWMSVLAIGLRGKRLATTRTEGMLKEAEAGGQLLVPLLLREGFDSDAV
jgi:hypothetical protein